MQAAVKAHKQTAIPPPEQEPERNLWQEYYKAVTTAKCLASQMRMLNENGGPGINRKFTTFSFDNFSLSVGLILRHFSGKFDIQVMNIFRAIVLIRCCRKMKCSIQCNALKKNGRVVSNVQSSRFHHTQFSMFTRWLWRYHSELHMNTFIYVINAISSPLLPLFYLCHCSTVK